MPKRKTSDGRRKSSTKMIFGEDIMSHGYTAVPGISVRAKARLGLNPTQFNVLIQVLGISWIRIGHRTLQSAIC